MPRRARTHMVILGLLTIKPMNGYELKQTIDRSIRHFWSESFGQLYPALKELRAQGLVEANEHRKGGRVSQVYSITKAGLAAFDAWLEEPPAPRVVRNEALLRVFFGLRARPERLRALLRQEAQAARGAAAGLSAAQAELRESCAQDPELPYWLLTLDLGVRSAEVRAQWAQDALETLELGGE